MQNTCRTCNRASICLLAQLTPNTTQLLNTLQFNAKTLKRGEHLCHQGQTSDNLYILRAGSLKSYVTKANGEAFVMGFYFPPDLFGWEGLDDQQRATSIVALDESNICIIPTEKMFALTQQSPALGAQLLKMVSRRIHQDNVALLRTSAEQRVATFLLQLVTRFSHIGFSNLTFQLPMKHQDIANYLHITPNTISRIFHDLQKKKLLKLVRNTIQLCDIPQIQMIAEMDDAVI